MNEELKHKVGYPLKPHINQMLKNVYTTIELDDLENVQNMDTEASICNPSEFNSNRFYCQENRNSDFQVCLCFRNKETRKNKRRKDCQEWFNSYIPCDELYNFKSYDKIKDHNIILSNEGDFDQEALMDELFGELPSAKTYYELFSSEVDTHEVIHVNKNIKNDKQSFSKIESTKGIKTTTQPNIVPYKLFHNNTNYDYSVSMGKDLLCFSPSLSFLQISMELFLIAFAFLFFALYVREINRRRPKYVFNTIYYREKDNYLVHDLY